MECLVPEGSGRIERVTRVDARGHGYETVFVAAAWHGDSGEYGPDLGPFRDWRAAERAIREALTVRPNPTT